MEIKGTAVNAVRELVLTNFKPRYDEWINSLPDESRKIIGSIILANKWYPMREALIEPLGKACKLFYNNDKKNGAWKYGRFIADYDVRKIFKLFFLFGSPAFTIKRAPNIFKTYFSPGEMKIIENSPGKAILQIVEFPDPQELVEFAIAGWIEHSLEMIGCKSAEILITQSMIKGNPITEFAMKWSS